MAELKNTFHMGLLAEPPDNRDFSLKAYPPELLVNKWTRPERLQIGLQGAGSCTGWAGAYALEAFLQMVMSKGLLYAIREASEWQGIGRFMHEMLNTLLKYGDVPLAQYPYDEEVPDALDRANTYRVQLAALAAKYKIKAFAKVTTEAEIKTAMMAGLEIVCAVKVDKFEANWDGVWECETEALGRHAMHLWDFSDEYPKMFKVSNSWGVGWGKNGYCYKSAEDIISLHDVYAIQFVEAEKEDETPISPVIQRTLRLASPYMRGEDVKLCQTRLIAHGWPVLMDGVYGNQTKTAVMNFQAERGLTVDGICGKYTWGALLEKYQEDDTPGSIIDEMCRDLQRECEVHSMYALGAQGQRGRQITEEFIHRREGYGNDAKRAIKFWKEQVSAGYGLSMGAFDCSGLIKYWLDNKGLTLKENDWSSRDFYNNCLKLADRTGLQRGDLLFRHNGLRIHHVGVYIGYINGKKMVIECKGRDDGVVMREIDASSATYWNRYGRLKILM